MTEQEAPGASTGEMQASPSEPSSSNTIFEPIPGPSGINTERKRLVASNQEPANDPDQNPNEPEIKKIKKEEAPEEVYDTTHWPQFDVPFSFKTEPTDDSDTEDD